jgi:hypothetical protein
MPTHVRNADTGARLTGTRSRATMDSSEPEESAMHAEHAMVNPESDDE